MKEQLSRKANEMEIDINQFKEKIEAVHNEKKLLLNKLESLQIRIVVLENENLKLKEKISWMAVTNESNCMIKKKMDEIVADKKQLAYEKGVLQTHLQKLKEELSGLQDCVVSKFLSIY